MFVPADLPIGKLDQAIEDFCEKQKQDNKAKIYKRFTQFLFQDPTAQPQQQALSNPQPVQFVSDNSEAIRLINLKIQDPKTKDLETLIHLKRELQGETFPEEEPEIKSAPKQLSNNSDIQQPKKNYGWKVALPLFAVTIIISFGIIYAISGMLH